jgi:hypothetical protein
MQGWQTDLIGLALLAALYIAGRILSGTGKQAA